MRKSKTQKKIDEALVILRSLGMPRQQLNERSALCLLALLGLGPSDSWAGAKAPLVGITPMMDFARDQYKKAYAPNTRETFRRQTMHQFVQAGIALYNPDDSHRPVNSPNAVYQIDPRLLALLRQYGGPEWLLLIQEHLAGRETLSEQYEKDRGMSKVSVRTPAGMEFLLTAGEHSHLIGDVIQDFAPRFLPGAFLIYAGDTGAKWGHSELGYLATLGVSIEAHGKMPDVLFHFPERDWLVVVECVTSHGPVDAKRHVELQQLFSGCMHGLVYVTAFPTRRLMAKYVSEIAWETEVWVAEAPTHLIHFNGSRFLGPY